MELLPGILAGVLALAFLAAGAAKLAGVEQLATELESLGVGAAQRRLIGALEVSAAAGLALAFVVDGIGVAAAVGLVLLTTGAVIAHVRAGQGPKEYSGAAVLGLLAVTFIVVRLPL